MNQNPAHCAGQHLTRVHLAFILLARAGYPTHPGGTVAGVEDHFAKCDPAKAAKRLEELGYAVEARLENVVAST